jgi:hypothetical protein
MAFCNRCGTTSEESSGFCLTCGARLPVVESQPLPEILPARPFSRETQSAFPSMELAQPRAKSVWVAAMLAFLMGPLGMLYSTVPGCLVMFAVNLFAAIWGRTWMVVASWLACIVWAALAARE